MACQNMFWSIWSLLKFFNSKKIWLEGHLGLVVFPSAWQLGGPGFESWQRFKFLTKNNQPRALQQQQQWWKLQAIQIQSSISVQFGFHQQDCIGNRNFDQISIKFIQFRLNSTNFWLKEWLKDQKSQLKDRKSQNSTTSD